MRKLLTCTIGLAALGAMACGSVSTNDDAAPEFDASPTIDGSGSVDSGTIDAPLGADARQPVEIPPATEITSGGAKTSGAIYNMDIQIGHSFSQAPSTGGGKTIEGAAAVKE